MRIIAYFIFLSFYTQITYSETTYNKTIDSIYNIHSNKLINTHYITTKDTIIIYDSLYNSVLVQKMQSKNKNDSSKITTKIRRFFISTNIQDSITIERTDTIRFCNLIIKVCVNNDTIIDKYCLKNIQLLNNKETSIISNDSVYEKYFEPMILSISIILITLSLFFIN